MAHLSKANRSSFEKFSDDKEASYELRVEQIKQRINLKCLENDTDWKVPVAGTIFTIALFTPTERRQRDVNQLSDIHNCKKEELRTMEEYSNRYDARKARNVDQKNTISANNDQTWNLLLVESNNPTPDTRNSLTFKVTRGIANRMRNTGTSSLDTDLCMACLLGDARGKGSTATTMENFRAVLHDDKGAAQNMCSRIAEAYGADKREISFGADVVALLHIFVRLTKPPAMTTILASCTDQPVAKAEGADART